MGPATDTYALGCVLFEMLVGEPPYTGSTALAILGKIITGEPVSPVTTRPSLPAHVDAAIRRALERLPADRFTSAHGLSQALADPGFRHGELAAVGVADNVGPWKRFALIATTVAAGLAIAFGWSLFRPQPPLPVERFVVPLGRGLESDAELGSTIDLSSDGSMVAYEEGNQVWVHRFEDRESSPVPGTIGGGQPSFSPDGREIAFVQDRSIKRV